MTDVQERADEGTEVQTEEGYTDSGVESDAFATPEPNADAKSEPAAKRTKSKHNLRMFRDVVQYGPLTDDQTWVMAWRLFHAGLIGGASGVKGSRAVRAAAFAYLSENGVDALKGTVNDSIGGDFQTAMKVAPLAELLGYGFVADEPAVETPETSAAETPAE